MSQCSMQFYNPVNSVIRANAVVTTTMMMKSAKPAMTFSHVQRSEGDVTKPFLRNNFI